MAREYYVVARAVGARKGKRVAICHDENGSYIDLVDKAIFASYFTLAEAQRFCDCMQSQRADFTWEVRK